MVREIRQFTDISGQPIRAIFKGQGLDSWPLKWDRKIVSQRRC